MTRQPLFPLLCLLPLAVGLTQDKNLVLKKVSDPPAIDGLIDSMWAQADSATGFFQTQPYYAQQPSRNTVAKVLTTDEALYCLIICYDDQHNIRRPRENWMTSRETSSRSCLIPSAIGRRPISSP